MKALFLLFTGISFGLTAQTISDTIRIKKHELSFYPLGNYFPVLGRYFVDSSEFQFSAGEGIAGSDYIVSMRSYISADISNIPPGRIIAKASLFIFQKFCYGNGISGNFPVLLDQQGNKTYCRVDHVSLGTTLDSLDWSAGDSGNPNTLSSDIGNLSTDSISEFKTFDITNTVSLDRAQGRTMTQYRLRFPVVYDDDGLNDFLTFEGPNHPARYPFILVWSYPTDIQNKSTMIPNRISISCYPNPFNPTTTIRYSIPAPMIVSLELKNILGQTIQTLVHKEQFAGEYSLRFDANGLSSGVYLFSLRAGGISKLLKVSLLK